MKISICHWGGEPIRTFASGDQIQHSDREVFKKWAGYLSDPATARDEWMTWVTLGRVWFEVPSSDHLRRLLIRPFYHQEASGVRGKWSFCGFVFPISDGVPAVWTTVLRRLLMAQEVELSESDGHLSIEDINPWQVTKQCTSPTGQTFSGSYADALEHLCDSIAGCTWKQIEDLHIACHPPAAFSSVNSLVLADNFPIKNIRIIPENLAHLNDRTETSIRIVPPKLPDTTSENKNMRKDDYPIKRWHPLRILMAGFIVGTLAGAVVGWHLGNASASTAQNASAKRISDLEFLLADANKHFETERTEKNKIAEELKALMEMSPTGSNNNSSGTTRSHPNIR